jgi:hypothetical protein
MRKDLFGEAVLYLSTFDTQLGLGSCHVSASGQKASRNQSNIIPILGNLTLYSVVIKTHTT